ncbi:putative aldehyde dehydrogenase AldA [Phytophthora citrophthora]|uniref:Aldehyde dehydrogenase AldA n=1 Tax=Phytophthora citrophthora TaxID=4793 RepID=A0AAD9LT82_9STRA|nr:putative aldehyde dehydrogenase AldA [Phytophthora citrophthora]
MWRLASRSPLIHTRLRPRLVSTTTVFDRDEYGLFIDGKFVSGSGSRLEVENPATTERLAYVSTATVEDVDRAVTSGQRAFKDGTWSRTSVGDRANVLNDIAKALRLRIPEFAEKESLQTGRPIREMKAQLARIPGEKRDTAEKGAEH